MSKNYDTIEVPHDLFIDIYKLAEHIADCDGDYQNAYEAEDIMEIMLTMWPELAHKPTPRRVKVRDDYTLEEEVRYEKWCKVCQHKWPCEDAVIL